MAPCAQQEINMPLMPLMPSIRPASKHSHLKQRLSTLALASALASLLGACAVPRALEATEQLAYQGNMEAAIEGLRQAKKDHPKDMRLDNAMYKQVGNLAAQYLREAEQALAAGDEAVAQQRLNKVLEYDSGNMRARQMIDQLDSRRYLETLLAEAKKLADSKPAEALKLTERVLEEYPSWTDASQLRDTLMRRKAESQTLAPTLDASLQQPVSLNFRATNLMQIFETISKLAGVNFIFDADVSGNATASISASQTTAEDAINLLLATHQLRKKILSHNTLLIYPARADKERQYRDMAVKTFFLSHASAKSVSAAMKSMIKIRDVHVDERVNAVVVRDAPDTLELASRLVQALDRPEAEVTLDVQVLEVSSNDATRLGVQYPEGVTVGLNGAEKEGERTSPNIPLDAIRKSNLFVNLNGQSGLTLNMLQTASNLQVLANPKIRVRNGKKAQIEIGQKIPVVTNLMSDAGATSERVEMLDVGLKFDVLPTISLDGEIAVDIDLTVSSLGAVEVSPKKARFYRVNQRKIKTTLTANDNETQILAGLINREDRESSTGLPGLSRIPLLGRLFGSDEDGKDRTELVLVITPHIERKLELPGAHVTTFISGTEAHVSQDSLVLRGTEGARVGGEGDGNGDGGGDGEKSAPVLPEPAPPSASAPSPEKT
jgi:general secretion pathway protein D